MKDQVRQTQMVMGFGPGSMMDLPTKSVMIAGLDHWVYTADELADAIIQEPRLLSRLSERLGVKELTLRRPPRGTDDPAEYKSFVGAWRFPRWFVATNDRKTADGNIERRLVHRRELADGKFYLDNKQYPIIPIRFVRACPNGHIDDINWNVLVHGGETQCRRPKWVVERGNAGDLAEVFVRCECGVSVAMSGAANRSRRALGMCDGARPWLGAMAHEPCGVPSQLLIRSASNAYFSERQTVISIPASSGGKDEQVRRVKLMLDLSANEREDLRGMRKTEPLKTTLAGLTDTEVWEAYDRLQSGAVVAARSVKEEEFEALSAPPAQLGSDVPEGDFFARLLPKPDWEAAWMSGISRVVLVHRLRSVTALLGFTRFEASSADINGELDQAVKSATLARDISWLPAIEMRGEGIFIEFDAAAIGKWMERREVQVRFQQLQDGYNEWKKEHEASGRKFAGMPYIMLHSLSHLLQTAISLECGYSASSLQERVYAIQEGSNPGQFGILLYTAATDAQGTLGGLVEAGRSIKKHMKRALESALLCSSDPVCAQHSPTALGSAQLQGAACHGCLLVPETSCEQRNDFLDRALVVPTVESEGAAFFEGII
ncbi:MAG: DUF1998 domain-containing protein [Planctomycetota bacterium]|nr:MAG: DUF1998 domain-containing protein [Planctomycetota bacterium]